MQSMAPATPGIRQAASQRVTLLPGVLAGALLLLSWVPRIAGNAALAWSFRGAAGVLLLWLVVLLAHVHNTGVIPTLLFRPRKQHYIQALVQTSVYLYWGYFWAPVYDYAWLLLGQLLFAYAADMLLNWSRREEYVLG